MIKKYKGVLAIDFDGTIAHSKWPKIKFPVKGSKKYINKLYNDGWYIIIWTCRTDENTKDKPLTMAINWLNDKGYKYHLINQQCPRLLKIYNNDTRKIAADFYIDDKSISGLPSWNTIYNQLKKLKNFKTCLFYERDEW